MTLLMGSTCKNFLINDELPQVSILDPTLFLPAFLIKEIPNQVTCNSVIRLDDNTVYSKHNQVSDLWQQLELATEHEFDL